MENKTISRPTLERRGTSFRRPLLQESPRPQPLLSLQLLPRGRSQTLTTRVPSLIQSVTPRDHEDARVTSLLDDGDPTVSSSSDGDFTSGVQAQTPARSSASLKKALQGHRQMMSLTSAPAEKYRQKLEHRRQAAGPDGPLPPHASEHRLAQFDGGCRKVLQAWDGTRKRFRSMIGPATRGRTTETRGDGSSPSRAMGMAELTGVSTATVGMCTTFMVGDAVPSVAPASPGVEPFPALTGVPDMVRQAGGCLALQSRNATTGDQLALHGQDAEDFLDHVATTPGPAPFKLSAGFLRYREAAASNRHTCLALLNASQASTRADAAQGVLAFGMPEVQAASAALSVGINSVAKPAALLATGFAADLSGSFLSFATAGLTTFGAITDIGQGKLIHGLCNLQKQQANARIAALKTMAGGQDPHGPDDTFALDPALGVPHEEEALAKLFCRNMATHLKRQHDEAVSERKFAKAQMALGAARIAGGATGAAVGVAAPLIAAGVAAGAAMPYIPAAVGAALTMTVVSAVATQQAVRHHRTHRDKWDARAAAALLATHPFDKVEALALQSGRVSVTSGVGDYIGGDEVYAGTKRREVDFARNIFAAQHLLADKILGTISAPDFDLDGAEASWMMTMLRGFGLDEVVATARLSCASHHLQSGDRPQALQAIKDMVADAIALKPMPREVPHPSVFFKPVAAALGHKPSTLFSHHVPARRSVAMKALRDAGIDIPTFLASMAELRHIHEDPIFRRGSAVVDAMLRLAEVIDGRPVAPPRDMWVKQKKAKAGDGSEGLILVD